MTDGNRGTKRRRERRTDQAHSSSVESGTQEDNHQSNGAAFASLQWHGKRTRQPPCSTEFGEGNATDTGSFHGYQDGLQPTWQHTTHLPYTERTLYDPPSWNPQSQYMASNTDTVEAQRDQSWLGEPYRVEDSNRFLECNTPYPHTSPQNQNTTMYGSQVHGTRLDMSLFPDPTTAYQSTSNLDYADDLSGMRPTLATQAYTCSEHANIESILDVIGKVGTGPNPDPWSLYKLDVTSRMFQQDPKSQGTYRNGTSSTVPSTWAHGNSDSNHQVADASWRCISPYGMNHNGMDNSMLPEPPTALNNQVTIEPVLCSSSLGSAPSGPAVLVRQATPPMDRSHDFNYTNFSDTGSSRIDPALLSTDMGSMTSDTQSCVSDAPSPAAPFEIDCDVEGCDVIFSGIHRKGNLARHKRLKHNGPKAYVCTDDLCGKVFKRQDARLKHYRKWHPRLASAYSARPQTRHRNHGPYSCFSSNTSS